MSLVVTAVLGIIGMIAVLALQRMAVDELRGRLDRVPWVLLKLARLRVPRELRSKLYDGEWMPELFHIMSLAETLPLTRLVKGIRYSVGILFVARRLGRMHSGRSALDIELRQLLSMHVAMDAFGNIATAIAGYASAVTAGFTGSFTLVTAVGLAAGSALWLPAKVVLIIVFTAIVGVPILVIAGPGLKATFNRFVVVYDSENVLVEISQDRLLRLLSAAGPVIQAERNFDWRSAEFDWRAMASAVIGCLPGTALAMLSDISVRTVVSATVIAIFGVVVLIVLRILLFSTATWCKRRRDRLKSARDGS